MNKLDQNSRFVPLSVCVIGQGGYICPTLKPMTKRLLLTILFGFSIAAYAQETLTADQKKKMLNQARNYIFVQDFGAALDIYKQLVGSEPENGTYNYETGICVYEGSFNKVASKKYFEKALEIADATNTRSQMPELFYYLGRVYHMEHDFLFATAAYSTYMAEALPSGKEGKLRQAEIENYIAQCEDGRDLIEQDQSLLERIDKKVKNVSKFYIDAHRYIRIENLGEEINTPFSEYGPVTIENGKYLVFTSRKSGSTGGELYHDGQYYEDIYFAELGPAGYSNVSKIDDATFFNGAILNTKRHNASVSIDHDEKELFIYQNNQVDHARKADGVWQAPIKLSEKFNRTGQQVTSATISPSGKEVVVVCNRFDTKGGFDLYLSKWDNTTNDWGEIMNLGSSINTELDETTPFFYDDTTLFFSSKGHFSIGGYDVFETKRLSDTVWGVPKTLGIPVNSPFDELNYSVNRDRSVAFYASNRNSGYGEFDIYRIVSGIDKAIDSLMSEGETNLLLVQVDSLPNGNLTNYKQEQLTAIAAAIAANPALKVDIVGIAEPGLTGDAASADARKKALEAYNFLLGLGVPEANIKVQYTGMKAEKDTELTTRDDHQKSGGDKPMQPIFEQTIYFGLNSFMITDWSKGKLSTGILKFLAENPNKKVYMSGHADHTGPDEHNLKLSEKRVKSVEGYLREMGVKNPIQAEYFGEAQPSVPTEDVETDPSKLIYNRRVKMVVFNQ
jgi:outer membrane protein OmpA-like peptidoglycan-associated protein